MYRLERGYYEVVEVELLLPRISLQWGMEIQNFSRLKLHKCNLEFGSQPI